MLPSFRSSWGSSVFLIIWDLLFSILCFLFRFEDDCYRLKFIKKYFNTIFLLLNSWITTWIAFFWSSVSESRLVLIKLYWCSITFWLFSTPCCSAQSSLPFPHVSAIGLDLIRFFRGIIGCCCMYLEAFKLIKYKDY